MSVCVFVLSGLIWFYFTVKLIIDPGKFYNSFKGGYIHPPPIKKSPGPGRLVFKYLILLPIPNNHGIFMIIEILVCVFNRKMLCLVPNQFKFTLYMVVPQKNKNLSLVLNHFKLTRECYIIHRKCNV